MGLHVLLSGWGINCLLTAEKDTVKTVIRVAPHALISVLLLTCQKT
jgi:hypothetical protein